jgi:hypothetical protein
MTHTNARPDRRAAVRLTMAMVVAVFSGWSTPAGVGAPPTTSPAGDISAHRIVLKHVVALDLVYQMGWGDASNLPTGVQSIDVEPLDNSITVKSNEAGLAAVQEAISIVDVPRTVVEIKVVAVAAKDADTAEAGIVYTKVGKDPASSGEQMAMGAKVVALLSSLRTNGEVLVDQDLKTTNSVPVICEGGGIVSVLIPVLKGLKMSLIPNLQGDGAAVQFDMATLTTFVKVDKDAGPITVTTETSAEPKVKSGDTLVLRGLFRTIDQKKVDKDERGFETGPYDAELMVFLTPTVTTL